MRKSDVRRRGPDAEPAIKEAKKALITKARNTIGILLDSPGGGNGGNTGKEYALKKLDQFTQITSFLLSQML